MSKYTIYQKACHQVVGFQAMGEAFIRKLVINNNARSTHENYLRQMSKLALFYNRTPLEIQVDQMEEYLYYLIQKDTDSMSSFKHLVYGLRKLYQLFGKEELQLALPAIKNNQKLPVVFSKQEVKCLLKACKHIREKVMFALTYDTGIRLSELSNLLIADIDLDRGQVHIRKTKSKKQRYLIISNHTIRGLKKHLALNNPLVYVFENPSRKGMPISHTRIRVLLKEAIEKADIRKRASVHTLRHTYATHQLESGQNIMVVKESLGHADIKNTLLYLHIALLDPAKKYGCMDILYPTENG